MVETHKKEGQIEAFGTRMREAGRTHFTNPALPTSRFGSHGGESLAPLHYLNTMAIDPQIYEMIQSCTNANLRISAMYLRLASITILIINAYFWVGIGLVEDNFVILEQIYLLVSILNLPFVLHADFNFTPDILRDSGWLSKMAAQLVVPEGPTSTCSSRIIQYFVISNSIFPLVHSLKIDYMVPWGPHFGLVLRLKAKPLAVRGLVQCLPKDLPMEDFVEKWDTMNQYEQYDSWGTASAKAPNTLNAHKHKTGIGILGRPPESLLKDPKYSGSFLFDSLEVGQHLAWVALSIEYMILSVVGIPKNSWHQYIGRSQYPKFKYKHLVPANNPNTLYCDDDLVYWGQFKNLAMLCLKSSSRSESCSHRFREGVGRFVDHAKWYKDAMTRLPESMVTAAASVLESTEWQNFTAPDMELPNSSLREKLIIFKNMAQDIFGNLAATVMAKHNQDWVKFCAEQLHKGGGLLFKFISKADKAFLNVDFSQMGGDDKSPEKFLNNEKLKWGEQWSPPNLSEEWKQELLLNLRDFRKHAKSNVDSSQHTPHNYKNAINAYKKDTKGIDVWTITILKQLPDICISHLADAMKHSVDLVAIAHQMLISLNALLGKPGGGVRTIAKTPMLYRIFNNVTNAVQNWEEQYIKSYDTARKGFGALDAALQRNLAAEVAQLLGYEYAAVFNDFKKFFDSIDISTLLVEALHAEYPPVELSMALQQHLAPRVLQVSGFSSSPLNIWLSILAGCKQSVPITRALLGREFESLVEEYPEAPPRPYVDDTSMFGKDKRASKVIDKVSPCIISFAKRCKRLRLPLSPKGTICASNLKIAKFMQQEFRKHGIIFKIARSHRDLGACFATGKSNPRKLLNARHKKVKTRICKISSIAKHNKRANKLFKGSAFPAAVWSHQASGFSPTSMVQLEREALRCCGIPSGRCRFSALCVYYGPMGHPTARIIRELIISWFKLLSKLDHGISILDITQAWIRAKMNLAQCNFSIKQVKGILSNVIYMLHRSGWDPISYNLWADPQGDIWTLHKDGCSPQGVAAMIIKSHNAKEALRASEYYGGRGMEHDIDWNISLSLNRGEFSKHYPALCGLQTIQCGACWPAHRISEIDPTFSPSCPRCGHECEDSLHTFWTCPANDNLTDDAVANTQYLIPKAVSGALEAPCLWLRGLMPATMVVIDPMHTPTDKLNITYIGEPEFGSGLYYGDASGGDYTSYNPLRRCGVGVSKVNPLTCTQLWGAKMNLPGEVQTVARAELYFIFFLLSRAVIGARFEIVTDNLKNCELYNKGPAAASKSINADLFKAIFYYIETSGLTVKVRWMPSHIKEKRDKDPNFAVPSFVTELDIQGNSWADVLAGEAAKVTQINDMNVPTQYLYHYHLVRKIQRRLVSILCALPNRPKHVPKVHIPRDPIDNLVANTAHFVFRPDPTSNILQCIRCKTKARLGTRFVRQWLNGQCSAVGCAHDRPIKLPYEHIQLANNIVHHSHNMYKFLDYFYCNRCGLRARERVNKLSIPCEPPRSAGLQFLEDIKSGKLLLTRDPRPVNATPAEFKSNLSLSVYNSISHKSADQQEKVALARWANEFAEIAANTQPPAHSNDDVDPEPISTSSHDVPMNININNTDDEDIEIDSDSD